jgi:MFS family permease
MAAAAGVSRTFVFGAFSAALLLSAVLGPAVGRRIDRHGGTGVLIVSNLVLAAGLLGLAAATGIVSLTLAWGVMSIGMALGLYDAAFATLTAIYGRAARTPITGITLVAGFASTIGWPLSAALDAAIGWRGTCVAWAAMQILIALPLNLLLPRATANRSDGEVESASWQPRREMTLLAFVFAASWFVTGAMAAHLPALLERMGATAVQTVAAAALIGPAQVAARLVEFLVMRRPHPLVTARFAISLHPLGAIALAALGALMALKPRPAPPHH